MGRKASKKPHNRPFPAQPQKVTRHKNATTLNLDTISGYIERLTFQNPENGFTVARLKVRGRRDLVVIVGTMPSVQAGESVRCEGQWREDSNYGLQFQVEQYRVEPPQSVEGIQRYLGSGMIKGIGPVFAERIVTHHREQTLEVIDTNPQALLEIDGIGPKRLERITACWTEQKAVRELMLFLQSHQINPTYAQKVYRIYGDDSRRIIEDNPYQLARDVWGIGFKTADQTARKLGIDPQSELRIDAGVEYVLSKLADDGHTCYPQTDFLERARQLLEVPAERIAERLQHIAADDRIVLEAMEYEGESQPFIWLKAFYLSEQGIAREIQRLSAAPPATRFPEPMRQLEGAEHRLGIVLSEGQRRAVSAALTHKLHILTGGPGTGKSTITRVILEIAKTQHPKILLAAPTGRAAKRLGEIIGRAASTIHSLLEYDFSIGGFRKRHDNPLDCQFLVVDEASMIDTVLLYSLLKAVPGYARVLLIGDADQLPSVGAGSTLQDLIASERVPVSRLTDIFRQAAQSRIITNAHRINAGRFPDIRVDKKGDFFFVEDDDPEHIAQTIVALVKKRLPRAYGYDSLRDIQVLSPMNRGLAGNRNLNKRLQSALNPSDAPLIKLGRSFHAGDKVMQIQNNYDKEVFNGDVGYLRRIDPIEQEVQVEFDGRTLVYDFTELDELVLAYSVSVHKFQGSECPCVVIPLHTTHYLLLHRNLLYTGITRGKQLVVIIGSKRALAIAVRNDRAGNRFTGLRARL